MFATCFAIACWELLVEQIIFSLSPKTPPCSSGNVDSSWVMACPAGDTASGHTSCNRPPALRTSGSHLAQSFGSLALSVWPGCLFQDHTSPTHPIATFTRNEKCCSTSRSSENRKLSPASSIPDCVQPGPLNLVT
ncbi:hypothetical protein HBI76_081710 [Parastagonospora nodorum]|nr:hypothetical protein HBI76_081710 [Parastagonospora nodorum]